jgi:hypothetical protein
MPRLPLALASRTLVAAAAVASTSACTLKAEAPPPFEFIVNVTSDPGHPLPGAVITKGGKEGPSTGTDGRVTVKIVGQEGEQVDFLIKCPSDYVSPSKPLSVLLRRNVGTKLPEYDATCPPAMRHMVVAVRADNGGNLPVKVLDKIVGYTDANGAFTYAVALKPGDGVEMVLDTSNNPLLTPRSPSSSTLVMKPYDDVLTFDQKFNVAEVKKVYKAKQVPVEIKSRPHRGL